jgi:ABC-2 type transport system permease protein
VSAVAPNAAGSDASAVRGLGGPVAPVDMGFRSARRASLVAFWALLLRDLRVLQKGVGVFAIRTVMQPLLLVFVFTFVFPKIGQGIGGSSSSEAAFSTLLMAGVIATSMIFQGVQAVALPLVQEFGYTREIEDRVMAPLPVWGVAAEKIASGAVRRSSPALSCSRWRRSSPPRRCTCTSTGSSC